MQSLCEFDPSANSLSTADGTEQRCEPKITTTIAITLFVITLLVLVDIVSVNRAWWIPSCASANVLTYMQIGSPSQNDLWKYIID